MSRIGNRPDCAYFLLLGLSLGVFLVAIGSVLTYIAYWPDTSLSQNHGTHHHGHKNNHNFTSKHLHELHMHEIPPDNKYLKLESKEIRNEEILEQRIIAFEIIGPICIGFGLIIAMIVGALGLKFDCDHEPEPNIAFLRLKSELSLSFNLEKNKYELMLPLQSPIRDNKTEAERSTTQDPNPNPTRY